MFSWFCCSLFDFHRPVSTFLSRSNTFLLSNFALAKSIKVEVFDNDYWDCSVQSFVQYQGSRMLTHVTQFCSVYINMSNIDVGVKPLPNNCQSHEIQYTSQGFWLMSPKQSASYASLAHSSAGLEQPRKRKKHNNEILRHLLSEVSTGILTDVH